MAEQLHHVDFIMDIGVANTVWLLTRPADGKFKLVDGQSDRISFKTNEVRMPEQLVVSQQGNALAVTTPDHHIDVQIINGQKVSIVPDEIGSKLALSGNSTVIAMISNSGQITVWDIHPRQRLITFPSQSDIQCFTLSNDGQWIASTSLVNTQVWKTQSGQLVQAVQNRDVACAVAFSADGKQIGLGYNSRQIRVYDIATGQTVSAMSIGLDPIASLAFSPVGTLLLITES